MIGRRLRLPELSPNTWPVPGRARLQIPQSYFILEPTIAPPARLGDQGDHPGLRRITRPSPRPGSSGSMWSTDLGRAENDRPVSSRVVRGPGPDETRIAGQRQLSDPRTRGDYQGASSRAAQGPHRFDSTPTRPELPVAAPLAMPPLRLLREAPSPSTRSTRPFRGSSSRVGWTFPARPSIRWATAGHARPQLGARQALRVRLGTVSVPRGGFDASGHGGGGLHGPGSHRGQDHAPDFLDGGPPGRPDLPVRPSVRGVEAAGPPGAGPGVDPSASPVPMGRPWLSMDALAGAPSFASATQTPTDCRGTASTASWPTSSSMLNPCAALVFRVPELPRRGVGVPAE